MDLYLYMHACTVSNVYIDLYTLMFWSICEQTHIRHSKHSANRCQAIWYASVRERSTAYPVICYASVHEGVTSTLPHPNPVQPADMLATRYQNLTHPHRALYQPLPKTNRQDRFSKNTAGAQPPGGDGPKNNKKGMSKLAARKAYTKNTLGGHLSKMYLIPTKAGRLSAMVWKNLRGQMTHGSVGIVPRKKPERGMMYVCKCKRG